MSIFYSYRIAMFRHSASRKDDTPDATQANGGLTKQQKRAARLALDTATQVVQAAAHLAKTPFAMAAGSMGAASATAPVGGVNVAVHGM